MAEDTRKLTQEERDQIAQWIRKAMGDAAKMPCPVCKNDKWTVAEHLVVMPVISPEGTGSLSGISYPHSPIICQICGFTYFINSVRAGVSKQREDDEPAAKAAEEQEEKDG